MITTLLAAFAVSPFLPVNGVPLPPDSREFTFVALGDNRPAGAGLPPTDVFSEIIREVGYIHPAFVLSSGDLVYGNEESIEQYRKESGQVLSILNGLRVPFYNALGNHEVDDRPELQSEYLKLFGGLYGSFDYGGCRFVALCTDEAGKAADMSDAQKSWLDKTLDGSKPSFLYLHRPVFARAGNDEKGATVANAAALHELFKSRNVKGVFEGHDHVYDRQSHDGIDYVISGGAGAPLDAATEKGGFFHYLLVHVKDGKTDINVIPANAIQVVTEGGHTRVSNYADVDIELQDLTVNLPSRPSGVSGVVDKKGKLSKIPVELTKVDKVSLGYQAHVKVKLVMHKPIILSFH